MKKYLVCGLITILVGLIFSGVNSKIALANGRAKDLSDKGPGNDQQVVQTQAPTALPIDTSEATPEPRVLPPVGSNVGLVIAASVLVLIIIGGVLGSRRRAKH